MCEHECTEMCKCVGVCVPCVLSVYVLVSFFFCDCLPAADAALAGNCGPFTAGLKPICIAFTPAEARRGTTNKNRKKNGKSNEYNEEIYNIRV